MNNNISLDNKLIHDIRQIVIESKNNAIQSINGILIMMYWQICNTINQDILKNNRADYGRSIVATLWRQLQTVFAHIVSKEEVVSVMREFKYVFGDCYE